MGEPTRRGRAVPARFSHGARGDHGGSLETGFPRGHPAEGTSIRSHPGTEGPGGRGNGSAKAMSAPQTGAREAFRGAPRVLRVRNQPLGARVDRAGTDDLANPHDFPRSPSRGPLPEDPGKERPPLRVGAAVGMFARSPATERPRGRTPADATHSADGASGAGASGAEASAAGAEPFLRSSAA